MQKDRNGIIQVFWAHHRNSGGMKAFRGTSAKSPRKCRKTHVSILASFVSKAIKPQFCSVIHKTYRHENMLLKLLIAAATTLEALSCAVAMDASLWVAGICLIWCRVRRRAYSTS